MSAQEYKKSRFKSGFFFGSLVGGFIGYLLGHKQANLPEDNELNLFVSEANKNVKEFIVNMRELFARAFDAGQTAARDKQREGRTPPQDYDLDNPDL